MKYIHTNIVAKDWEALSQFYIKVFECVVVPPERNLKGEWLDRAVGLKNAHLRGVHLALPGYEEGGPTLEIFTYESTRVQEPLMADHTGFTHIAFEVEDVQGVLDRALDNGATMLGEVTSQAYEGKGTLTFVYFRDPEGNIIEILNWNK
jgi:predicted enzyme related to lactoylglutathione lyase